jgi:hypothetical protein
MISLGACSRPATPSKGISSSLDAWISAVLLLPFRLLESPLHAFRFHKEGQRELPDVRCVRDLRNDRRVDLITDMAAEDRRRPSVTRRMRTDT